MPTKHPKRLTYEELDKSYNIFSWFPTILTQSRTQQSWEYVGKICGHPNSSTRDQYCYECKLKIANAFTHPSESEGGG